MHPFGVRRLAALLVVLLMVCGCTALPDQGPVREVERVDGNVPVEPPYFQPPGPAPGDSKEAIVRGFLTAMEANPVNIRAAREFLSDRAGETWRPTQATLVYQATALRAAGDRVRVRLSGVSRLSAEGNWLPSRQNSRDLTLRLVREQGEWRIDTPPNALIVGAAFFRSTFAMYPVWFYDNTGQILVPRLVHLPRGEQTATNLVRALLGGPDATMAQIASSAFPERTEIDLAVTVTRAGVADVPVSSNVLDLSGTELERAMVQLAWTLRAVPGISRVQLSVDGVPVPQADGRTGVDITEGLDLAPYGSKTSRIPVGVRAGRVVRVDEGEITATDGPLGRRGFALRTVAQTRDATDVAAVSENGTRAWTAALSGVDPPRRLASGADFARPVIDRHDATWLLDRRPSGARVLLDHGDGVRTIQVPGVSGTSATQIMVSPDGVRLAAVVTEGRRPRLVLANIVRDRRGMVRRVVAPRSLSVADAATVTDVGPGVDLGWLDDTTVAVLTAPTAASSRVTAVPIDGSAPGDTNRLDDLNVVGEQLVVSPLPDVPVGILSRDGRLHVADSAGKWQEPGPEKLTGLAYPG